MITLTIPGKPITANMQARVAVFKAAAVYRGRMYKSTPARAYQSLVYSMALDEALRVGWVMPYYAVVEIKYYNIRADVDGVPKLILDGLQGVWYSNDARIKRLVVEPYKDAKGARTIVSCRPMTWEEAQQKGLKVPIKYRV